ncbi:PqqD family peptide modification chaperone [Aquabacter spiritensis]|nr:PqqD family peptide modification chaperone [Aquabacter spiritensis]
MRQGDWLSARIDNELVMMSPEHGRYLNLSEVGAEIWEILAEPRTLDGLVEELVGRFEVDEEVCRAETLAFLSELARVDAVSLDPPPER